MIIAALACATGVALLVWLLGRGASSPLERLCFAAGCGVIGGLVTGLGGLALGTLS